MNLKEIINPSHTVLIVWDVQNLLVNGIFNKQEFLKNLKSLIEVARSKKIPIIYSKITPLPKEYESSFRTFMFMKRFKIKDPEKLPRFLEPGTPESEITSEIRPLDDDIVIEKNTASIFIGTNFEYLMRNKGIDTILFTGISTEFGIASSARDSCNRGFYTVVVKDCVSSYNQKFHENTLEILKNICLVEPFQNIMKEWE
ncbi:MAG: isochorismatase family cysteine hydrolase [Promethearchaeota archaeon]